MVRKSTQSVSNKGAGIYFLIRGGVVTYIGQTTNLAARLMQHKIQLMNYDSFRFIECSEWRLDFYEKRWIRKFMPIENKAQKGKKGYIKKRKLILKKKHMHFRKLTRKSFIGFGQYKYKTVDQVMALGKVVDIIDIYFNLSHITFFDDILDELKITQDWRIEKPGTDKELGFAFKRAVYPEVTRLRYNISQLADRGDSFEALKNLKKGNSKIILQNKNHGR